MNIKKSFFSTLLIFTLLFSFFVIPGRGVHADDKLSITNVSISPQGVLTWDAIPNMVGSYRIWYRMNSYSRAVSTTDTSYDLYSYFVSNYFKSGQCTITLSGQDYQGNKYEWVGTYSYVNELPNTPDPYNIRLEGDYLKWDFDWSFCDKAEIRFEVDMYKFENGYAYNGTYGRTSETSIYVGAGFQSGTHDYRFFVQAEPSNTDHGRSNRVKMDISNITREPPQLTGLQYDNGILTWNPVEGATRYSITLSTASETKFEYPKEPRLDLAKVLGEQSRDLTIYVQATKDTENSGYHYLTKNAMLSIHYEFQDYGLNILGKKVDLQSDLNDLLGDGGSVKYIPTERKLILTNLNNDVLDKLDYTQYSKDQPLFKAKSALTIEGKCDVRLQGPFIEMDAQLIFAPNSSIRALSYNGCSIQSKNVWVQGGMVDLTGCDVALSITDYLTISDGTTEVKVESTTDGGKAINCGYVNGDGKITIPESMSIVVPDGGKLSRNLKTVITADSYVASKVIFSAVEVHVTPTPTPTPKATNTPKPTKSTVPTVNPTAVPTKSTVPTSNPAPTKSTVPTSKPAKPTAAATKAPKPTTAPADQKSQILAFVERLYSCVLDREPETDGASYWSDELYSFRRTGAEVAQGFIFSPEFEERGTTDEEFVTILYNTFFDREPEAEGIEYWISQLTSGAMDRVAVANGFIYSQEWADTCASYGIRSGGDLKPTGTIEPTAQTYAFVERMYTTAMGRDYDEEGKQYWAGELANFNVTGEFVGAAFFLSEEMANYKLGYGEYIDRLYLTFMDREADEGGKGYWLSFLSEGHSTAEVVFGFTRSPEFVEKCIDARILPY